MLLKKASVPSMYAPNFGFYEGFDVIYPKLFEMMKSIITNQSNQSIYNILTHKWQIRRNHRFSKILFRNRSNWKG